MGFELQRHRDGADTKVPLTVRGALHNIHTTLFLFSNAAPPRIDLL